MNYPEASDGASRIVTAHGALELSADGRVAAVSGSGPANAGDGLATDLARAILAGTPLSATEGSVRVVTVSGATHRPPAAAVRPERAIAVDMTNWSVIVDDDLVVKVVSEWNGADRAARLLRRLAERSSTVIPAFRGHIDWTVPGRGTSTVALVSDAVADSADGWTWAVDDVLAFLAGGREPAWPAQLGTLAARLHADLAPPTAVDAPTGATPTGPALRERAARALDAALAATAGPAGLRLANREGSLRAAIASIPDDPRGVAFEGHGDLHVGQVLRSGDGALWVIDFDGDPQLDREARELPDFAARDVAHLLTSVDLVAAVVQRRLGGQRDDVWRWATRARTTLLARYRALADRPFDERLLPGFEAEQLARELLYAARFLERWSYAPDAAISHRHSPDPATTEEPWTPPAFSTT